MEPEVIDTDQVFLSKLTGILAFKKMAKRCAEISFVFKDAKAALRKCSSISLQFCMLMVGRSLNMYLFLSALNHLTPSVSLVTKY